MTPKNSDFVYDMFSENPSEEAKNVWARIFSAAKKDQDKILKKAKK